MAADSPEKLAGFQILAGCSRHLDYMPLGAAPDFSVRRRGTSREGELVACELRHARFPACESCARHKDIEFGREVGHVLFWGDDRHYYAVSRPNSMSLWLFGCTLQREPAGHRPARVVPLTSFPPARERSSMLARWARRRVALTEQVPSPQIDLWCQARVAARPPGRSFDVRARGGMD